MKSIVLFGSIPLARKCLEFLFSKKDIKVVGVLTKTNYKSSEETVAEFAIRNNIPIINFEICEKLKPDIGFSIRFHKILKTKTINSFKYGIINLHGGPLPYYKGSCNNIFAILNKEKKFGVTLHYIDEGIDTGDIIAQKIFSVSQEETGYSLYLKTIHKGFELFEENINSIINLTNIRIKQNDIKSNYFKKSYYYKKKDLENFKCIDIKNQGISEITRIVRAFYFPGKEGAYFKDGKSKIYLTLNQDKNNC